MAALATLIAAGAAAASKVGLDADAAGKQRTAVEQASKDAQDALILNERQASQRRIEAGEALEAGSGEALATLQGGADEFRNLGAVDTANVLGARSRLGELFDQGGPDFSNFEADPGFQFRQQQGEQAINRAASASGGRLSGGTLAQLAQFNSGLASQEFGNFANRELARSGQQLQAAAGADSNALQALFNQAGRQDAAALQAQQIGQGGLLSLLQGQAGVQERLGGNLAANLGARADDQFRNAGLLQEAIFAPAGFAGAESSAISNAGQDVGKTVLGFVNAGTQAASTASGGF